VVIDDGQTVVLGGLMKDTTSWQLTKVPVLGDLPVLGHLFRQREESISRKNLLIFVTARIIAPRGPTT
jgi:type IV pilus assembly protein PilQ